MPKWRYRPSVPTPPQPRPSQALRPLTPERHTRIAIGERQSRRRRRWVSKRTSCGSDRARPPRRLHGQAEQQSRPDGGPLARSPMSRTPSSGREGQSGSRGRARAGSSGTSGVTPTDAATACPLFLAMQHCGVADGPISSTVSHDHASCKHKSSSVGAVDQTAGAGAEQSPCRRRSGRRALPQSDVGVGQSSDGEPRFCGPRAG